MLSLSLAPPHSLLIFRTDSLGAALKINKEVATKPIDTIIKETKDAFNQIPPPKIPPIPESLKVFLLFL
jgi:hypothetical protein